MGSVPGDIVGTQLHFLRGGLGVSTRLGQESGPRFLRLESEWAGCRGVGSKSGILGVRYESELWPMQDSSRMLVCTATALLVSDSLFPRGYHPPSPAQPRALLHLSPTPS